MIEMVYHLQLNEALGPEMQFLGAHARRQGRGQPGSARWLVLAVGAGAVRAGAAPLSPRVGRDPGRDRDGDQAPGGRSMSTRRHRCAVELRDLRKSFGKTEIIRGTSLAVKPGERVAIIGPNGAGKSTLFNLISGRFGATSGEILLQRRAHRRQAAVRDQPPRPGAQLPGQQPVHAAVGVREHALRGALAPGLPLRVLALPRRPEGRQRARRARCWR